MTALLAAGYVLFAFVSLAFLEDSLHSEMEAKLTTVARAASDIVDDDHGEPSVDADDVTQFNALHGSDEHLGVFARSGKLLFGEPLPAGAQGAKFLIVRTPSLHDGHNLGWVVAWRDTSWIATVRRSAIVAFVLTGSALAALAFISSGTYARAVLTPVERVADLAERLESSDLSQRLNAKGRDELARLCASFDRMLERLQASFEAERRFVGDASHELRAPLAVVRAETDLALRRERTAEEYRSALESIDRETARLEELVDNLLQTMRDQATLETSPIDPVRIARTLAQRMQHTARIDVESNGDPIVAGNAQSIERALSAVVHNAIAHGGGNVRISVHDGETHARIVVADDGPGFSRAALHHATERFWRGDSARSRGGSGLGLSIAHVLVEAHGGSLVLANGRRRGAVVTITLPRAVRTLATS
jgi:signal transduction histidine kinase